MQLQTLFRQVDAETARAFVVAARQVIDAMLIEARRIEQTRTPTPRNYDDAGLPREAPPGGWISHSELRRVTQEMAEAIAAERWCDGVLAAVRLLSRIGGGA